MENWQIFTDPRFLLQFRYPTVTPQGNMVELQEEQTSDLARVHLISRDSQEVYFEVRRYRDLLPQEEYQRHTTYLEQRLELEGFTITGLIDHAVGASPAHQYSFQWDDQQRVAILIQQEHFTYRIIYDPVSPINLQILSTVKLIA
ncbi:MAG TPA: hypothetical protein VFR47_07190 [Anaerolineales bacterium]|nr:hypothetical protein [Anaerolineales bacterium]